MIITNNERLPKQASAPKSTSYRPTLVIHGGAGPASVPHIPPEQEEAYQTALRNSLRSGFDILESGGSALDAACHAVASMEDNPLFNSGKGAVFNKAGFNELEASVMVAKAPSSKLIQRHANVERNRRCASAVLIRNTKNPVMLARALYLNSAKNPHVILSGTEAERIGWNSGCEKVDSSYFYTRERWLEHRRELGLPEGDDPACCNVNSDFNCSTSDLSEGTTAFSSDPPPSYGSVQSAATPSLFRSSDSDNEGEKSARQVDSSSEEIATPIRTSFGSTGDLALGMDESFTHWDESYDSPTREENPFTAAEEQSREGEAASDGQRQIPWRNLESISTSPRRRTLDWSPTGTVGAVALDKEGNLASATSTGGITNKLPGRVGDTPTPGAGFWAEYWKGGRTKVVEHLPSKESSLEGGEDEENRHGCFECIRGLFGLRRASVSKDEESNGIEKTTSEPIPKSSERTKYTKASHMKVPNSLSKNSDPYRGVAVSGTGTGDYFLRSSFASLLVHRMRFLGENVSEAGQSAIDEMGELGGVGGAICIDNDGQISFPVYGSAIFNRGFIREGEDAKVSVYPSKECA